MECLGNTYVIRKISDVSTKHNWKQTHQILAFEGNQTAYIGIHIYLLILEFCVKTNPMEPNIREIGQTTYYTNIFEIISCGWYPIALRFFKKLHRQQKDPLKNVICFKCVLFFSHHFVQVGTICIQSVFILKKS